MAVQTGATLDEEFSRHFARSRELFARASTHIVGGITHDSRAFGPFPIYVTRAQGSKKWDVDGHEILDHWMGHGALILGHNHPSVVDSVQEQLTLGTHYGACHELEVEWAAGVPKLSMKASGFRGQKQEISFGAGYGFTEEAGPGQVYKYRFNTNELKKPLQEAATSNGWSYKGVQSL